LLLQLLHSDLLEQLLEKQTALLSADPPPMFRFQLEIAGFLAGSAVVSAFTLWITGGRDGKIQLPMHEDDDDGLGRDPVDVTKPMDFVDGYPVEESEFWTKVCELYVLGSTSKT
jgi:hypothetical protein